MSQANTANSNNSTKPTISFEFFPTKSEQGLEKLVQTFDTLNELNPTYFSVTYGAGGSTRERTLDVINALHNRTDTQSPPTYLALAIVKPKLPSC